MLAIPHTILQVSSSSTALKESTSTRPFAYVVAKKGVSENGLEVAARDISISSRLDSCSVIKLLTEASRCSFISSESTWSTVRIGTGGDLNDAISLSARKMTFMKLLINDVPRRSETATFLKIQSITRI